MDQPTPPETPVPSNLPANNKQGINKKYLWIFGLVFLGIITGGFFIFKGRILNPITSPANNTSTANNNPQQIVSSAGAPVSFHVPMANVSFVRQQINISPDLSKPFADFEIQNIADIEKAYGFKFTSTELQQLEQNKFVIKNILDTNLGKNVTVSDNSREFVALYQKVIRDSDYKNRTQANSVFISSDGLFNLFSVLSVELLKETENKYLYGQMQDMTKRLYDQASVKLKNATSDNERKQWTKVRNYFAVPYAIFSMSLKPITAQDYWNSEYQQNGISVDEVQANFQSKDKDADSYQNVANFVKSLQLDAQSESDVLADLTNIYNASGSDLPKIFLQEYQSIPGPIQFKIPFSLFKPRGTYTSTSLRRQYFRAVQWYQQIPFFLSSKDLTNYALDIGQLVHADTDMTKKYNSFSSLIAFLVGESDDLDVNDYSQVFADLGPDKARNKNVLIDYLNQKKLGPKIKALPANYPSVGDVSVSDVFEATRGMRFISQKFVPDSYWTGQLTQGDEKPAVNGMKLPDMASSLEVMSLLGSPYATNHLVDLDFYLTHKQAIDSRLADLKTEVNSWGDNYWQSNLYTSTLWSISGLFDWLTNNRSSAPQFMQSPLWDAKTLLTGSGFWTELRHTSILYAKQSFAEKGAGGDDSCDDRKVPPPPKGYIEPQPDAYDRLYYMAQRLSGEYKARGFELSNLDKLDNYIKLVNIIREYTKLELENTAFDEPTVTKTRHSADENKDCVEYFISPDAMVNRGGNNYWNPASRWEEIRTYIVQQMASSLPVPVEGPILPIKDKRTAVIADVHTGKEGQVLEEGTGVPRVIFVAVKDANGPRLTVGFTYSQYEEVSPGDRWTDEQWQDKFYTDSGDYSITYQPKSAWPDINKWYQQLLGIK